MAHTSYSFTLCVCVCQGVLDPHTVSSSLQQMWALTEVMQSNQTSASIGRFEVIPTRRRQRCPLQAALQRCVLTRCLFVCLQVDGCYDINLLSLT